MTTSEELYYIVRSLEPSEGFKKIQTLTFHQNFDFTQIGRILECLAAERRWEVVKFLHMAVQPVQAVLSAQTLTTMLNKIKEEDSLRTLMTIEKRISPTAFRVAELGRVLETILDRDRFKAVQTICCVLNAEQDLLSIDDITGILQKVPNFGLQTVVILKPWISKNLDFTRCRQALEACTDKNTRIEVLGELTSVSTNSTPNLRCSEIRGILSSLPQRFAEKGLKMMAHLFSPSFDIHRVELVFECVMKTDQVKVLTTLLADSKIHITSMNEIRSIIEKMDQPYRGLEILAERIDTSIDLNKIAVLLNIIPSIKRGDALQLFCELLNSGNTCSLSAFELRSVLMLMEPNTIVNALRLLLTRFEPSSDRDFERIMECFSEANKPIAEAILQQKFKIKTNNEQSRLGFIESDQYLL